MVSACGKATGVHATELLRKATSSSARQANFRERYNVLSELKHLHSERTCSLARSLTASASSCGETICQQLLSNLIRMRTKSPSTGFDSQYLSVMFIHYLRGANEVMFSSVVKVVL